MINMYRLEPSKRPDILKDLNTLIIDSLQILFSLRLFGFLEVVISSDGNGGTIIRQIVECGIIDLISDIYSTEYDESLLVCISFLCRIPNFLRRE